MAKFNPTIQGSLLFGKKNGQNISLTRNGSVIRNTTQPPKTATPKQSVQRYQTTYIAKQYLLLDAIDRIKWSNAATQYNYINAAGLLVERTALGAFYFLNQNRILILEPTELAPPTFTAPLPADIVDISISKFELKIQDVAADVNQVYVVFCELHFTESQISFTPKPIVTELINGATLKVGIDILPKIATAFNYVPNDYRIVYQIIAIVSNNGNRDLNPKTHTAFKFLP